MVVVELALVLAVPAFADRSSSNSFEGVYKESDEGFLNYGHCQSQYAKGPGSAKVAKDANPAFDTGQEGGSFAILCPPPAK